MNLLARLFGHPSLTAAWRADSSIPLTVDLGACQFCGVPLGAPIERLAHLGPSAQQQVRGPETVIVYPRLGLQVFIEQACFDTLDVYLQPDTDMASFAGQWLLHGQPLALTAHSTPAQVQALLGQPDTETEISLLYARGPNRIDFEWNETGQLENVMLHPQAA